MRRDELKQPLHRRSLIERLWQQRPSALVTAYAAMLVTYAGSGAWLVHQKLPFAGEPVITMQIPVLETVQTAKPVVISQAGSAKASPDDEVVQDVETASTDSADVQVPEAPKQKITKLDSHVTIITSSRPVLVKAPVEAISEKTEQGFLPRIAANGKKPSEIYAKPVGLNTIHSDTPKIVIILGGMGLNEKLTRKAIDDLPATITFAFAPYGNNLQAQVDKARDGGHEVLLQLPLEPVGFPGTNPGPKTLLADADGATNLDALYWHMSRFAGYAGVVNYMGGKFLAAPNAVRSLLTELKHRGLAFIEDGSLPMSAIDQVATSMGMPVRHGNVQIDQNPDAASITAALEDLEKQASGGGIAIGTGSGLDVTVQAVKDWAHDAESRGIEIIPATAAFKGRTG